MECVVRRFAVLPSPGLGFGTHDGLIRKVEVLSSTNYPTPYSCRVAKAGVLSLFDVAPHGRSTFISGEHEHRRENLSEIARIAIADLRQVGTRHAPPPATTMIITFSRRPSLLLRNAAC